MDYYTGDYFNNSTIITLLPVRNDMQKRAVITRKQAEQIARKPLRSDVVNTRVLSPSPHPSPTRGEGIKPLLEIKDFGPPARGGHFVLFHSFLPPQPYGTQFHSVHTSPVQLVSLVLPPRRREGKITVTPSLIREWKLNTLQTNNIKPSPQLSTKKYLNFLKKYYIIY